MDSAEKQRKKPCFGKLRCWDFIQRKCPVYSECYALAGGVRMIDRVKAAAKSAASRNSN